MGKMKVGNEKGFVLVTALFVLVLLTFLGIAANQNTVLELQIAGNDKLKKMAFYNADGGTEFASEVLEQNIACLLFSTGGAGAGTVDRDGNAVAGIVIDLNMAVETSASQFWQNGIGTWSTSGNPFPSNSARDMWFPPTYAAAEPHTNITVEGLVDIAADSSILFSAGYLGLGRSSAAGGVELKYDVTAQHIGANNSESVITVEWTHVVGKEDPFCRYD